MSDQHPARADDPGYRFEVARGEVGSLIGHLEASEIGPSVALEVVPVGPSQPEKLSRLGFDRRLHSSIPDAVVIAISGGGGALAQALASVIREYIRAHRTTVRLHRRNGDVLELEGTLSVDEIARLMDHDGTHGLPAGDEA